MAVSLAKPLPKPNATRPKYAADQPIKQLPMSNQQCEYFSSLVNCINLRGKQKMMLFGIRISDVQQRIMLCINLNIALSCGFGFVDSNKLHERIQSSRRQRSNLQHILPPPVRPEAATINMASRPRTGI